MVVVDTSVWVEVFRDRTGRARDSLRAAIGSGDLVLTRFTELELLQGCRDEKEWGLLSSYFEGQDWLEVAPWTWSRAARTYFDLRRRGLTVRSPIDCCIAQIALDHEALLLHRDRDFEAIGRVRPLREQWLDVGA